MSDTALYLLQGGITLPSTDFYLSRAHEMQLKREGYKKVARRVLREVCRLWHGCHVERLFVACHQRMYLYDASFCCMRVSVLLMHVLVRCMYKYDGCVWCTPVSVCVLHASERVLVAGE
jgi:hypothetical protein